MYLRKHSGGRTGQHPGHVQHEMLLGHEQECEHNTGVWRRMKDLAQVRNLLCAEGNRPSSGCQAEKILSWAWQGIWGNWASLVVSGLKGKWGARTQWQQGGDMEICFQNLLVNIDHLTDQWSLCTKNYLVLANQIWFFIKPVFSPREIFLAAGHNLLEKSELSHSLASNSWASAILSLFSPNSIPPVKNRHYFLSYVLPRKPRNLNMPW